MQYANITWLHFYLANFSFRSSCCLAAYITLLRWIEQECLTVAEKKAADTEKKASSAIAALVSEMKQAASTATDEAAVLQKELDDADKKSAVDKAP